MRWIWVGRCVHSTPALLPLLNNSPVLVGAPRTLYLVDPVAGAGSVGEFRWVRGVYGDLDVRPWIPSSVRVSDIAVLRSRLWF